MEGRKEGRKNIKEGKEGREEGTEKEGSKLVIHIVCDYYPSREVKLSSAICFFFGWLGLGCQSVVVRYFTPFLEIGVVVGVVVEEEDALI